MEQNKNEDFIMVSIACATYNHEPYIRQCLEGFVMQKTNFKFEAVVHDDASTDKTPDIIREYEAKYPDIIKPIYQKTNGFGSERNKNMKFKAWRGKYLAMCEGDDYWTDPYKLQKQVDFLEKNEEYLGAIHYARFYNLKENKFSSWIYGENYKRYYIIWLDILREGNNIPSCSVIFRKEYYSLPLPKWYSKTPYGDMAMYFHLLSNNRKFYIFKEVMAQYNYGEGLYSGSNNTERVRKELMSFLIPINYNILLIIKYFWLSKYFRKLLYRNLKQFARQQI